MATNKKAIQKTAVKKDTPAVDPVIKEEKLVNTEKVEPVKVEGKSPMELEALKNGGVLDPVSKKVESTEVEEKKEVDPISEKTQEGLQSGTLAVEVSVSKETIVEKLLEKANPEEVVTAGQKAIVISKEEMPLHDMGKSFHEEGKPEESTKLKPEVQEDIKQATAIVGAIAELSQNSEYKAKAKELMEAQNLKEIWRCADSGYWFSRQDYAEEYERKNECSLEYYKK